MARGAVGQADVRIQYQPCLQIVIIKSQKNNLEYSYQDFEIWKALWLKLQTDKIDLS